MADIVAPFYPIIYIRGYAGNDSEIDDAVADPYMGFNIGATKFRQSWTGAVERHYFESPLYRLTKDFGYTDVYSNGEHMPADLVIPARSVVIYRYYDEQFLENIAHEGDISSISGRRREIEQFADGLSDLILRLRQRICGNDSSAWDAFRVYLIAHSMGGLISRCFLQNANVGDAEAKAVVDKVFTYATPHAGIDFSVIGNVPGFFSMNNADNFNERRMKEYLGFRRNSSKQPNDIDGKFDPDRFFCLVGTNWNDYKVAAGWSRRLVGPMSDGLVRIVNASITDTRTKKSCPRAFVHRSHSGHMGIVNSEDGYQNLVRFLFGDVRVDGILEVDELSLPKDVAKAKRDGKQIRASYHFETVVRVRGADWDLHRRTVNEQSAIFRTYDELKPKHGSPRHPRLFSAFLLTSAIAKRANTETGSSLVFSVELRVQVPEYVVDGLLWFDQKIKGSYLLRETIIVEAIPPSEGAGNWQVRYGLASHKPLEAGQEAVVRVQKDSLEFRIPLNSGTTPGFKGTLALRAKPWN
ncbi:hypothetical protein GYB59_02845 [bacterium]|nr:hypothetical protein [bacterium]